MANAYGSQKAYLQGPQVAKHAYLEGVIFIAAAWRNVYLRGAIAATPDSTPAYLYGGGGASSSTPAMCQGPELEASSRVSAFLTSISKSSTPAYLSGPT